MVTDLVEIRRLGIASEAENLEFRRHLSARRHRAGEFQSLAAEIQEQVDCTACANCCRNSIVTVNGSEVEAIARYLGYTVEQVTRQYTAPDPNSPAARVLATTVKGCVFLDGNLCTIYEARPKACRDFPHVALGRRSLGGRMSSLCRWASLCPIVYNALESYKHLVGYRPAGTARSRH